MNLITRSRLWLAPILAIALIAAACGSDSGDSGNGDLSGTVRLDGSSTVGPLTEVAAELFTDENSGVDVTVAISGTSGGFEKFCNGETDGNNASRAIKEEEIEQCEGNDIAYDAIQVANDALSIVVNQDNPLECITVEQANQIWNEGSTVSSWGDVDGLDAGDLSGESLTLYGPGTDSGTFDFFTEAINGEEGVIRNDYINIGEDDNAAVTGVAGEVGAMGYIPYSYLQESLDQVKALQIDGGDGCIEPTLENVQNGTYSPLGRPLFLYASDTALARSETAAFFEFYINNAEEIADTAGFVPLTADQMSEQLTKVQELAS